MLYLLLNYNSFNSNKSDILFKLIMKAILINQFFDIFTSNSNKKIKILKINVFLFMGLIGYVIGFIFFISITIFIKLNLFITLFIIVISSITFLLFNYIKKVITGIEEYIFYHNFFIVLLSIFVFLKVNKMPVIPFLELLCYSIALMQIIGRLGCLKSGCCYGRLNYWGITYNETLYKNKIPYYFINKRLFPVQFIESLLILIIFSSGILFIINDFKPGTGLIYYLVSYSLIRFFLEFKRGDIDRKYFLFLSEAQWTGSIIILILIILQIFNILPYYSILFYYSLTCLICLVFIILIIELNFKQYSLFLPRHILEIADIIEKYPVKNSQLKVIKKENIKIKRTSKGLLISKGVITINNKLNTIVTFSHESIKLNKNIARLIGKYILIITTINKKCTISKGNLGVFHIVIS